MAVAAMRGKGWSIDMPLGWRDLPAKSFAPGRKTFQALGTCPMPTNKKAPYGHHSLGL